MKYSVNLLVNLTVILSVIPLNATDASTQKFVNYISRLEKFDPDFNELLTPQAKMVLTPQIEQSTLDAIVKAIEMRKPRLAKSYSNPYSTDAYDAYKLLLVKIALMTHHKEIIENIPESSLDLQKEAFFVSVYEADLNDIANAQEFIEMLHTVHIDNTDELGYTPLAVAAVIKKSPELTRTILGLKPDINYMMDELYKSKGYKAKEKLIQTKTVLDLIENAQSQEKNSVKEENLSIIRDLLLQHGAKTVAQLAAEKQASKAPLKPVREEPVAWDFSDDE